MARRSRSFALLVWLTAATTLFATSPHLECVCPDGSRKPFCLSLILDESSCCSDADAPEAGASAPSCCCEKPAPTKRTGDKVHVSAKQASKGRPGWASRGCAKSLIEAVTAVTAKSETAAATGHFASSYMSVLHTNPCAVSDVALVRTTSFQGIALPPPPDRVVLFEHFLI